MGEGEGRKKDYGSLSTFSYEVSRSISKSKKINLFYNYLTLENGALFRVFQPLWSRSFTYLLTAMSRSIQYFRGRECFAEVNRECRLLVFTRGPKTYTHLLPFLAQPIPFHEPTLSILSHHLRSCTQRLLNPSKCSLQLSRQVILKPSFT